MKMSGIISRHVKRKIAAAVLAAILIDQFPVTVFCEPLEPGAVYAEDAVQAGEEQTEPAAGEEQTEPAAGEEQAEPAAGEEQTEPAAGEEQIEPAGEQAGAEDGKGMIPYA